MKVGKKGDVIVTHALGSCLGLMVYDSEAHVGGVASCHVAPFQDQP